VKFTLCSQNSPNESNIEEEHTLPTTHVQHFSAEYLFIYLRKQRFGKFYFYFSEFQQLGNKYAK
jgi:hypothetical protein